MEKITDKLAALPADADFFSLEFFPPKTATGFENLRHRLERMNHALRPLFVSVTWGAGGSTYTSSLDLAAICQRDLGLTTCLHLTCTNMSRRLVDKALQEAKALGIRNILALRGDPPQEDAYTGVAGDDQDDTGPPFTWAIDLVRHIRATHGDYFCIGVAAYPEGHADGSHPSAQGYHLDLPHLVEKVQAGADFIITQLFFDTAAYQRFESTLRQHPSHAFDTIPIIPGLMPVQSHQMIKRITKLSHVKMPDMAIARLDAVKGDDEQVKSVGVDIIAELIDQIRNPVSKPPGRQGFHFYTLNLEKAVSLIVERAGLAPPSSLSPNEGQPSSLPRLQINGCEPALADVHSSGAPPSSSSDSRNGRQRAGLEASRANSLGLADDKDALEREATWDDFPNGRFGDSRSPAYGEIDGYGVSLHMSADQAVRLWGHPQTPQDITRLFVRHMRGEIPAIPWSEEELSPESSTIKDRLLALNTDGWWTVASQPAVNGLPSTDTTFGWGPSNGFVFQKAFVEFFLPSSRWRPLLDKLTAAPSVSFYATNARGDFVSSEGARPSAYDEDARMSANAVTWGVFPDKEIVTPTIVEEVSFRAWAEEAFGIWDEWAKVYGRGSDSEKLLQALRDDCWLVNAIHHEFPNQDALWELLAS